MFKDKYFNSNPWWMQPCIFIKDLWSRILVYLFWTWNSTWITILHRKNRFKVWWVLQIWRDMASQSESGNMGLIPTGSRAKSLCHPSSNLLGTEPVSACTLRISAAICLSKILFSWVSSVKILCWRILTLNMSIKPPLFWSTCSWARGHDSATLALKVFAAPGPFCVALSPSVQWHAGFYIAALSIIFSFLDFISGDLALTEL